MTDARERTNSGPLKNLWHRWQASKVLGHRNVRKCWNARSHVSVPVWHHKDYHRR